MNYRVLWEIDIFDAGSAHEAAEMALEIQRRSDSIATVFIVRDETGESIEVDLDDDSGSRDDDYPARGETSEPLPQACYRKMGRAIPYSTTMRR